MVTAYLLTMKLRKYGMILMTHGDNPSSDEKFFLQEMGRFQRRSKVY